MAVLARRLGNRRFDLSRALGARRTGPVTSFFSFVTACGLKVGMRSQIKNGMMCHMIADSSSKTKFRREYARGCDYQNLSARVQPNREASRDI